MDYGTQQAACPRCGSGADVRTVGELFDMLNGMQDEAIQRASRGGQQGPYPGQGYPDSGSGYSYAGTGYSDYGQGNQSRPMTNRSRPMTDDSTFSNDIGQDIANAVLGTAFRFVGRKIGRRVQRTFEERVIPTLEARAAQAQQQLQQSRAEQAAIVQRYPDLRGCLHDQIIFLDGGSNYVPISQLRMPVTLAQADELVAKLRAVP